MNTLTEREIQRFLVSALKKLGFRVCVTSNNRRTANTPATPDLFVHIRDGMWLGMEVKSESGLLSQKQSRLVEEGAVYVVRSIEEGIRLAVDRKNTRLLKIRGIAK